MYSDFKAEYLRKRNKILNDNTISEFTRENKLREIAGLKPLTIKEFNSRIITDLKF